MHKFTFIPLFIVEAATMNSCCVLCRSIYQEKNILDFVASVQQLSVQRNINMWQTKTVVDLNSVNIPQCLCIELPPVTIWLCCSQKRMKKRTESTNYWFFCSTVKYFPVLSNIGQKKMNQYFYFYQSICSQHSYLYLITEFTLLRTSLCDQ